MLSNVIRRGLRPGTISSCAAVASSLGMGYYLNNPQGDAPRTAGGDGSRLRLQAPWSMLHSLVPVLHAKEASSIATSSMTASSSIPIVRKAEIAQTEKKGESSSEGLTPSEGYVRGQSMDAMDGQTIDPQQEVVGGAVEANRVKDEGGGEQGGDEGDEDTTCPFCLFNRRGPCGKQFRTWEKCIAKAKADNVDFVSHCTSDTRVLMTCMEDNPAYYKADEDSQDHEDIQPATDEQTHEHS